MDKDWMSNNRLSKEYEDGVESFLNFVVANGKDPDQMSCPCAKCGNLRIKDVKTIRAHLIYNGMDLTYHSWIFHGEKYQSHASEKDELKIEERDFYSEDPVDMVHEAFVDNPTHFSKLLEEAEMPLYHGCVQFTKLYAIVKLYNLKAKYSWSDTGFTDLLVLIGKMLPEDNLLPSSSYETKKSLSNLGMMKYKKIHACKKDCILYQKEYENLVNCPTCGESRWKVGKNGEINEGVPKKVLWYFSPIPRFEQMFRNKNISEDLTWHAHKRVKHGCLRHLVDSPSWKLLDQ